ncbi:MAG TPA: glycoside hydrolase family 9 protein [Bacteroidales bacterium]|nr:glycoside hydrolase family 9 protein [Bacteroidales bacterium]
MKKVLFILGLVLLSHLVYSQGLKLNKQEYFENGGVNVMVFQDIYPEGHQGGVALIMHGMRIATNGDIRLNQTPGQFQPIPKQKRRTVDSAANTISVNLTYPDSAINRKGFNPIEYPDLYFNYTVKVQSEGESVNITVDLDRPIPSSFGDKVGFNIEFFPGWLFGKSWYLDNSSGIFPQQANGPGLSENGELVSASPMAVGKKLTVAPEDDKLRFSIESSTSPIQLIDGRYMHNNGWFVARSVVPAGATKNAIKWKITPNAVKGWISEPAIHVSQVGYHPDQKKTAFVEIDKNDKKRDVVEIIKVNDNGNLQTSLKGTPKELGRFLRYNYLQYDFSEIKSPGMYIVKYGNKQSQVFKISSDVYERNVWQPTLEYFLPVQMCHMRINEKYRVWHGECHMDDARMAPVNYNHFDGYKQGPSTLTKFKSGDHVPGLNIGGWHDAGDYDLRVESQSGEVYVLTQIYEAFNVNYDETSIDQHSHVVEIHQPDGKNDILQQIEHGALTVVRGYQNLGRFYKGIICPTIRQYVLLGDGVNMTDGLIHSDSLKNSERTGSESSLTDDRWVFTEDNPTKDFRTAADLAAASRALKGFNDTLSRQCLEIAEAIFNRNIELKGRMISSKIPTAIELYKTTGNKIYKDFILKNDSLIAKQFMSLGPAISTVMQKIDNKDFTEMMRKAAKSFSSEISKQASGSPFGVPYRPQIWGAGWDIQSFGVKQYYLHQAFPDIFPADYVYNALNFILGVHPGSNTASFASGVGAKSTTIAYGINRADGSYIPGGSVSGTALIRPDFPELLDWPYLWQQMEYVMGGGATNFMFLVLAADKMLKEEKTK